MKTKTLILMSSLIIPCFAAPKPIARKTRMHRSEESSELCDLEFVTDELSLMSLGSKRSSSGNVTPVTPVSPANGSPQPQTRGTPIGKRARSTQPDDLQQN